MKIRPKTKNKGSNKINNRMSRNKLTERRRHKCTTKNNQNVVYSENAIEKNKNQ